MTYNAMGNSIPPPLINKQLLPISIDTSYTPSNSSHLSEQSYRLERVKRLGPRQLLIY